MITEENIQYTADEIKAMLKTCEKYNKAREKAKGERIRKVIYGWIYTQPSQFFDNGFSKEEMLTWLEKQGKSNTFKVPETSIKDAEEVTSRMQHIEDDMRPIAEFIINYANWNLHKDEWNQPTLTVPLFRVLDALIQRGKPYGECVQNIEKQGEKSTNIDVNKMVMEYSQTKDYNDIDPHFGIPVEDLMSTDKVEPKFHEGEWIIHQGTENIYQVIARIDNQYQLKYGDNYTVQKCADVDRCARLWNITKDAKDGDVLYLQHEGVEHIIIYKRLFKKNFHTILSVRCAYDGSTNDFFKDVDYYHCITSERDEKEIHPATKEQRDTLERSMTNAGYKWNKEKLKLEKI